MHAIHNHYLIFTNYFYFLFVPDETHRGDASSRVGSIPRGTSLNINNLEDSWGYDNMDGDADDSESVMTDLLSPGGQTDAQTLACMLQVLSLV